MEGIISKTVENLVIDSKALIVGGLKLKDKAQNYYTVEEVFKEVRHKQAREELSLLPFELKVRVPSEEAMRMVVEFAKKTGDFNILSKVDLRILALTLTIEKEVNGLNHIRKSPIPIQNNLNDQDEEEELEDDVEVEGEDENVDESKEEEITSKLEDLNVNGEEAEAEADQDQDQDESAQIEDDEDDEDDWITPSNLKSKIQKEFDLPEEEDTDRPPVKVACITGDYAMQRVLLQMNMNLFSMDGEHIKRINNFVMRCHACYQITTDLSKQFCPKCGGNTLMRTTTSIDQNGNMTYYLKKNFKYRLRGTKYSIPNPKGGHKNKDLILREDTPQYQRRLAYNNRRKEQDLFDPDFIPEILVGRDSNRFDPNSLKIGYGRKNPNQAKRRTGKKKH